ncbi:hypothetical protein OGAPHI_001797 [Ogataea philodendri]|uniref:Uncharacterized protein n=1 Tax=Ogataea philodendri TaxID=1378263 RepID=A0A9P8T6F8_9ASCO|nr:uncharacterized protein OGAPHI_001797 [Ogataea philodendri]KAH3668043.1 hypothetical protein OGAPHI_001797 [Ogataea philodendri]
MISPVNLSICNLSSSFTSVVAYPTNSSSRNGYLTSLDQQEMTLSSLDRFRVCKFERSNCNSSLSELISSSQSYSVPIQLLCARRRSGVFAGSVLDRGLLNETLSRSMDAPGPSSLAANAAKRVQSSPPLNRRARLECAGCGGDMVVTLLRTACASFECNAIMSKS